MAPGILESGESRTKQSVYHGSSKSTFPENGDTAEYAQGLDASDPLREFRKKFLIPSKASLRSTALSKPDHDSDDKGIYFCGNSLGLQPRCMSKYIQAQLDTWSSLNVHGHFRELENSPIVPWQSMAELAADKSSRIVGALKEEVAIENTLSVNLHLLMASFYRPSSTRNKILLEWKAFPSDHVSRNRPGRTSFLPLTPRPVCDRVTYRLAWV